jgi:phosphotransferase system enzyme I (PtsI)
MSDNAEIRYEGIGVSPGIAFGRIHVVREDLDEVVRYQIAPSQVGDEIGRFEAGLIQTRMQILEMQQRIAESIGAKDAAIFDAHLLVVEDRTLIDEVLRKLKTDLCNVEWAFQEVATRYAETLSKIDDPYLRERALDIQDVTKRVIRNLQGKAPKAFLSLSQPHILVAHNLTPSDTASMSRENVLGEVQKPFLAEQADVEVDTIEGAERTNRISAVFEDTRRIDSRWRRVELRQR